MSVLIKHVPADTVYPLRLKVLRPNRTLADCVWHGDTDVHTVHFAAFDGVQVIGIASIYLEPRSVDPPNSWRLRGMATEPGRQGQGIGTAVLDACLDHVRENSGALLWCNARTSALGFYRKHGFETVGEEFEIGGVGPHYVMVIRLVSARRGAAPAA